MQYKKEVSELFQSYDFSGKLSLGEVVARGTRKGRRFQSFKIDPTSLLIDTSLLIEEIAKKSHAMKS